MAAAARVMCIRGRYTMYLDRDSASLFYHDEVGVFFARSEMIHACMLLIQ